MDLESEQTGTDPRSAGGWFGRWRDLLDLGIEPDALPPTAMRRVRIISGATFAMIWIALLTILQAVIVGKLDVVAYLCVATTLGLLNLWLLRTFKRPDLSGHFSVAILAALISASAVVSGGFYDPSFAWLYIVPIAAAVALDARGAAAWSLITIGITIAFWSLPEAGIQLVDETPAEMQNMNALVARILTIGALAAMGIGFVMGQRRTDGVLERETNYLGLVMHAAVSANEARSFDEALGDAVDRICTAMHWQAGHVLVVDEDGTSHSSGQVYVAFSESTELERLSRNRSFDRGDGLPGRAVETGLPQIVIIDATTAQREPGPGRDRGMAAHDLGLTGAIAVPVLVYGQVRAVLEFACTQPIADPDRLCEVFQHIGVQLGRVAERTKLEDHVRQAQKMEALGQLAAGLAHEINNPMAFVRSNLHSLRELMEEDHKEDDAGQELIEESLEGVERTIAIVRDVMQFSRMGGAAPDQQSEADVNDLLRDSVRVASSDLPAGLTLQIDTGEIPLLRCAPNALRQVFLNLIVNAVQAVGDDGHIHLSSRFEGDAIIVRVDDDGPGLPPQHLERLFDPFFTTKPVGKGTGLGLTISYEIVQAHGGAIHVESEPGAGAVFEVRLPLDPSSRRPRI